MPRGRKKAVSQEPKPDPYEILHNLIQKARNLTDKDIWYFDFSNLEYLRFVIPVFNIFAYSYKYCLIKQRNHSLGGKKKNKQKIRATEKEEDEELMHEADLNTARYFHIDTQPSIIQNGQLRDYQLEGVSWLINLRNNGLHGILADEMGLGKTLQTIASLAYLRENEEINGIHLIIVPKSTIINWCREFKKWCPSFNVFALEAADKEERHELIRKHFPKNKETKKLEPTMDIIICSYEICMIEKAVLRKINYEYIIVDEAHRLKNNASKFSRILREEFSSNNRLLITGTPLQNNLKELWSLLNFLLPSLFSSAADFEAMFDFGNSDDEQAKIFGQLRVLLKPFLLRRLKINVAKDLPPKKELILFVGMTDLQKDIYKKLLLKEMNTLSVGDGAKISKTSLLNLVMQLRKCTNHPYLFEGVEDMTLDPFGQHLIDNCGKLLLLHKLLKKLKSNGSRVLIFSQMTRVLDILEDYCTITGYKYCRIDGSTSGEDRQIGMDEFNKENSDKFLFLLTTRAGGLGINLQTADIVIIYDSDWNPQMDLQAMDRAHRIGQKKPVFVYRLVTKDSVEERILERAELKLRLDAMVIQKHRKSAGNNNNKNNKKDELLEMIQYGADKIFKTKGSTITDDDIDTILEGSINDTAKLKEQWQQKTKKQFSELTLEFNYQQYEGEDYTKRRKERIKQIEQDRFKLVEYMNEEMQGGRPGGVNRSTRLATQFGQIGRSRKNYNENAYYRDKLNQARAINAANNAKPSYNQNQLPVPSKLPDIRYWQLYDVKNLYAINAKEWEWFNKWKNSPHFDEEKHISLTPEEKELKEKLLYDGFDDISYRDYSCFVRSCCKHGKDDIDSIIKDMLELMLMDVDDEDNDNENENENENKNDELKQEKIAMIKRYHVAFFEKAENVQELEVALERIEEGEKKRLARLERENLRDERIKERMIKRELWEKKKAEAAAKRAEKKKMMELRMKEQEEKYKTVLNDRVTKYRDFIKTSNDNIYKELQIPDAKCYDIGFNKEIDRFLFLITYKLGYGEWNKIYLSLIKHPLFQFNFLLKTLKPQQIKNRMDTILRACISSKKNNNSKKRQSREPSLETKMKNIQIDGGDGENENENDNDNLEPPNKRRKMN